MQNCFRQYPEIYGSEIDTDDDNDDDDDDDNMTADAAADVSSPNTATLSGEEPTSTSPRTPAPKDQKTKSIVPAPTPTGPHSPEKLAENRRELGLVPENYRPEEKAVKSQEPVSESEALVPKAAHDGR